MEPNLNESEIMMYNRFFNWFVRISFSSFFWRWFVFGYSFLIAIWHHLIPLKISFELYLGITFLFFVVVLSKKKSASSNRQFFFTAIGYVVACIISLFILGQAIPQAFIAILLGSLATGNFSYLNMLIANLEILITNI